MFYFQLVNRPFRYSKVESESNNTLVHLEESQMYTIVIEGLTPFNWITCTKIYRYLAPSRLFWRTAKRYITSEQMSVTILGRSMPNFKFILISTMISTYDVYLFKSRLTQNQYTKLIFSKFQISVHIHGTLVDCLLCRARVHFRFDPRGRGFKLGCQGMSAQ